MVLRLDIETYSAVDLKKSNAYRYSEDPSWLMLMCAWAVDDGPVQIAFDYSDIVAIPGLFDDEIEKVAHNAAFERINFSEFIRRLEGGDPHTYLDPEPWTCTQALAAEHGHPRKLAELAQALGGEQKDEAGTRLINLFCKPNRKGERNLPEDFPEEWQLFINYCLQDVETLRSVHKQLPTWPNLAERAAYMADQRINDEGLFVDKAMALEALKTAEANKLVQSAEVTRLTGVAVPGGPKLKDWLVAQGLNMPNMQKETVEAKLLEDLDPTVRRVLELRQELALVAAKKYSAALDRVNSDNRLRGAFTFFGAHTGRWTSQGVQVQNLPSATIKCYCPVCSDKDQDSIEGHVDTEIAAAVLDLMMGMGSEANTLKALVRNMFLGPFTVVDYSAIEARVLAWLAGEQWAIEAFEDGRDLYVETAERMGGMTRKEGKVAVLALGYNGGVNSLRAMGAEGEDAKLQKIVYKWRDANENIVGLWAQLDQAFRRGDEWAGEKLYIAKDGTSRQIVLPSGRAITYHNVGMRWETDQWNRRKQVITYSDPAKFPYKGTTYGGKLTENVTQAVARDLLSEALVRLQRHGHKVVGHVHDEILVEGVVPLEDVTKIMVDSPAWADGLPMDAEGFTCPRYRKD